MGSSVSQASSWIGDLEGWALELGLGRAWFKAERSRLLAPVRGRVLEIGFGTGLNLPHYGPGVAQLDVVDPAARLGRRVEARIRAAPMPVTVHRVGAEALPFAAGSFDCVVSTFTLCSIPEVEAALREVRRVLVPGGTFLFLEHGTSRDAGTARWQRRLDGLHAYVAGGCHINRPIDRLVGESGLCIEALERRDWPDAPFIYGDMYRGAAVAS